MTAQKRLVLDANILLRAVLGIPVRSLLETFEDSVLFYAPDVCFAMPANTFFPSVPNAKSTRSLEFWLSITCHA